MSEETTKDSFVEDENALYAEGGEPITFAKAQELLLEGERPFVLFRYKETVELGEGEGATEKEVVKAGLLYKGKDDDVKRITPESAGIHPVRLLLLTLTNLFFPKSGGDSPQPITADDEIFVVIREALRSANLDPHLFDGGGIQLG